MKIFQLTILIFLLGCQSGIVAQSDNADSSKEIKPFSTDESRNGRKSEKSRADDDRDFRRFEIGAHGWIMFMRDFDAAEVVFSRAGLFDNVFDSGRYDTGVGGRFTFNINRNLALETELNFTPSERSLQEIIDDGDTPRRTSSGGNKTQFLAGVKYGFRREKFGIFGKARPGVIKFAAFSSVDAKFVVPDPGGGPPKGILLFTTEKPATFFNIDVGGVFEYYPSKRVIFRFDIGDTIIRYHAQEPRDINPSYTRHNLQGSLGLGFRF